ncbi:hypothetical protein LCGC14_0386210 [marine sediment metagenome]|uniref:Uncharacterized protein n=1 Tax=marine sediment metagenome TaxID=412755 RepID=A0A0F9TJ20_9ZZZZ
MNDKVTIVFEDDGQDFLEWDLERNPQRPFDYLVIGCRPFQDWLWKGTIVHTENQSLGPILEVTTPAGRRTRVVHRVKMVKETQRKGTDERQ